MKNNKPEILFLHGYRGAPIGVEEIVTELRDYGFTVHVPAVPPFAGADLLTEYTPETYAKFVKNYIKNHNLVQPVLIGHSMGSIITAATAEKYPENINQKLILLSPISKRTPQAVSSLSMLAAYLPRKAVDKVTTRFLFVSKDKKLLRKTLEITDRCTRATNIPRRDMARAGRFSANNGITDFDFENDTLLLAGEKDRLVRKRDTEKLAKKLGAKLVLLEGTGHIHNYEKPHETAVEIIKFLEKAD